MIDAYLNVIAASISFEVTIRKLTLTHAQRINEIKLTTEYAVKLLRENSGRKWSFAGKHSQYKTNTQRTTG